VSRVSGLLYSVGVPNCRLKSLTRLQHTPAVGVGKLSQKLRRTSYFTVDVTFGCSSTHMKGAHGVGEPKKVVKQFSAQRFHLVSFLTATTSYSA